MIVVFVMYETRLVVAFPKCESTVGLSIKVAYSDRWDRE